MAAERGSKRRPIACAMVHHATSRKVSALRGTIVLSTTHGGSGAVSLTRAIVSRMLLLTALGLAAQPASAAFAHRKAISIDRARVPGTANHVDFPVLISIANDASLKTTANGGFVTSAQGHDILFRGEDVITCAPAASPCRLDHEIESYDGATGTLVAWVRVPTLQYSGALANTVVYLYYGDPTVGCSQQNRAGVWNSGYREVLHFNASGDQTDSTKNAFTAVDKGAVTNGVTGMVGPAVDLAGGALGLTPAYLDVSDGTLPTGTSFTLEAWVNFRSSNAGQFIGFLTKGRECLNFDGDPWEGPPDCLVPPCGDWTGLYKVPDGSGNDVFSFEWAWGVAVTCKPFGIKDPRLAAGQVATGTWYHVAASFNSATSTRRLYVNGTQLVTDTKGACIDAPIPHYTRLGTDSNQSYLDGQLDEVRISFANRAGGWIQTGYNNQSSPATFYASLVDAVGPFAVSATACPRLDPCAGGPGTCYLRSIGDTTPYSVGSGACSATNGSVVVTCPGAGWITANRGRGDRITIDSADYMVLAVDTETQLRLSSPFAGTTGVGNKSYSMARQFTTPQAWEDCVSTGGAACGSFPVAGGNLVSANRSEIGILYKDAPYTSAGTPIVTIAGATTDASHTITLTADGANRHYGIPGAGVVLDNTVNTTAAIVIQDLNVTVEWLEVKGGSGTSAHCIDFRPASAPNQALIRRNVVHDCGGAGIRLAGSAAAHGADISNNFLYRSGGPGVRIASLLGTGTGSLVRIFNNSFLRNNGPSEIVTAERPNPYVVLRNNITVDDTQASDSTWNSLALCTNAANCDWWSAASGANVTGDGPAPTGSWKPDIGPNPRGGGLASATEASVAFVSTTAGGEDLHIQAGSAAQDQASDLSGSVSGDIDAKIRTAPWDIGADEFAATALSADLAITKTNPTTTAVPGTPTSYTITVTNYGPDTINGLFVNDVSSAPIVGAAFTPSAGAYDPATGAWTGLTLVMNQTATLTLDGTIDPFARVSFDNTATVSPPAGADDPIALNDVATDMDTLDPSADVEIMKTDAPEPAPVGGLLTYSLAVRNFGPSGATSVTVSDPLPLDMDLDGAPATAIVTSQGSCSYDVPTRTVSCTLGNLAPAGVATVTINVRPGAARTYDNTATVTHGEPDPVAANDSDSEMTLVEVSTIGVRFFTATSTNQRNVLEWVNPTDPDYISTEIMVRGDRFPTGPGDGFSLYNGGVSGGRDKLPHATGALSNGMTFYYGAFVHRFPSLPAVSPGRFVTGRPFNHVPGPVKWAFSTGATALAAPTVGGAGVIATSNDKVVYAMERGIDDDQIGVDSGEWPASFRPKELLGPVQLRSPVVPVTVGTANPVVYLGAQDGRVYVVDATQGAAGSLPWSSTMIGPMVQAAPAGIFTAFLGAFDHLVVGTRDGGAPNAFVALDPFTGAVVDSFNNGGGASSIGIVNGMAAVDYGPPAPPRAYFTSYAGGSANTLWAFDLAAAPTVFNPIWMRALGNIDSSPVLRGGRIYVGGPLGPSGTVYSLDAITGLDDRVYHHNDGQVRGFVFPDRASNDLYFATDNFVWGITDTGAPMMADKFTGPVSLPVGARPSAVLFVPGSHYLYVGGSDGKLYEIDTLQATPVPKSVMLGDGLAAVGAPSLDNAKGLVHVGTEAGIFYAVSVPLP